MTKLKPLRWPLFRLRSAGIARLSLALLALASLGPALHAADTANSPLQAPVTCPLEYLETDYDVTSLAVTVATRAEPFKKEPVSTGTVIRGSLNLPGSGNSIPFVWQRGAGKLFLDLNQNQDLTDDPAGVVSAPDKRSYQSFNKIRLPVQTDQGRCQMLADINFWDYSPRPGCNLNLRCFWQGKVALHGEDWQVGIIPTMRSGKHGNRSLSLEDGSLLLRPWARRNQRFSTFNGSVAVVPFAPKVFLNTHAYQLDWITPPQKDGVQPTIQFTEQTVELGELKITGKHIQRLVLSGQPYVAILDLPAATVKVPVGSYGQPNIRLEQGGVEAYRALDHQLSNKRISIHAKTAAIVEIGGPLTNTVSVTRQGQDLYMDYRLVGVGGVPYQLANLDYTHPPEFAIYKADKKIASGKFEFG
jgi:hypothetical protein